MVDGDQVLAKLDQFDGYLGELQAVVPDRFEAYQRTACPHLDTLQPACSI